MPLQRWDMKETLLLASFPITSQKSNLLVKTSTHFAMHFAAGEAMKDHALHEGPAQSQLRLGCGPPSNAYKRPLTQKKIMLFPFDLPFTCKGLMLANYKAKAFL